MNTQVVAPRAIVDLVRMNVAAGRSGARLLHALKGAHPIEIKEALLAEGEFELLKDAFGSLLFDSQTLIEISREDNPVLSFWPFTSDAAEAVADLAMSSERIGLFGTPTVFPVLQERGHKQTFLFEQDDYFFQPGFGRKFIKCDLVSEVPKAFFGKFDFIVGDPPWYLDEYCAWLKVAKQLLSPNGKIAFSLFPEWVRANARNERGRILELIEGMFGGVTVHTDFLSYDTPSFEKVQLVRNGVEPLHWRTGDLITANSDLSVLPVQDTPKFSREIWIERRIGCGRLFIKAVPDSGIKAFLEMANSVDRFLASPSMRDPGRLIANVISSRGHGLRCQNPEKLLQLIDASSGNGGAITENGLIDQESRDLLQSVFDDLRPRFIDLYS